MVLVVRRCFRIVMVSVGRHLRQIHGAMAVLGLIMVMVQDHVQAHAQSAEARAHPQGEDAKDQQAMARPDHVESIQCLSGGVKGFGPQEPSRRPAQAPIRP